MAKGWDRDLKDPSHPSNRERKPHARKNTKRWCRGKVGVEHEPIIVFDPWGYVTKDHCHPAPPWIIKAFGTAWRCYHRERCSRCGKVLRHEIKQDECPDRHAAAISQP